MSDLFHESVPDEYIAAVFGVMACAPRHAFQVLTKRPERMKRWFETMRTTIPHDNTTLSPGHRMWNAICCTPGDWPKAWESEGGPPVPDEWPLPNVWRGVSVSRRGQQLGCRYEWRWHP